MVSVGDYKNSPTDENWYTQLKPVIGTFHANKETVRQQMQAMYDKGQRKITFVLWFMDCPDEPFPQEVNKDAKEFAGVCAGHVVDMNDSKLSPQHEQNVKDLIALAKRIGYNEIFLRFNHQGEADPMGWTAWDEKQFQKNWEFIANTCATARDAAKKAGVPVLFDLGGELGGGEGHTYTYTKKIWQNYYAWRKGDISDTYGFSVPLGAGQINTLIKMYDEAA